MGATLTSQQESARSIEYAKARLQAALKPDVNRKRIKRDNAILLRLVVPALLPFAGAVLFALYPPVIPEPGANWQAWLDVGFFSGIAVVLVGAFAWRSHRILTHWDHSRPDSPEDAIEEFYRQATRRRPSARRLGKLIASFEASGPRIRPVYSWLTPAAAPDVNSPKSVAKYWRALVYGNKDVVRKLKVIEKNIQTPIADVGVARLELRVKVVRRLQAMLSLLGGVVVVIVPFALGAEFMAQYGVSFWTGVGAGVTLGVGVALLLRRFSNAVVERRDVRLSKLLVRTSYNWRLVSGEWESEDEHDLTWLQTYSP